GVPREARGCGGVPREARGCGGVPRPSPATGPGCEPRLVDVILGHSRTLAAAGIDTPEADSFSLARHALGLSPASLRTTPAAAIAAHLLDLLDRLVALRALRIPLQHITGDVGFRHLTLTCAPGVFVPRPETEVLAQVAIDRARAAAAERGRAVLVEPCTGSGAIALSVAHEVGGARVIATEVDPNAVALARENLASLTAGCGLAPGAVCDILAGDLLAPVPLDLRHEVDVIVANPPYLTPGELAICPPEVRDHDPPLALLAGDDGHAISDRLLHTSLGWLRVGGALLLEVSEIRAAEVAARAAGIGYDDVSVAADLAGRPRVVVASKLRRQ
ncbi:MAG: peptide chain release factor N(5)-glutamine methyltransferase, partial [Actinomycetota bacterium]|nr:peptide chain release factor N(5)-glutamine methyltransferase [Actinomycetota bacterium]